MNTIKTLRKTLLLTQEQFARKIGASRISVGCWERGIYNPSISAAEKIIALAKQHNFLVTIGMLVRGE